MSADPLLAEFRTEPSAAAALSSTTAPTASDEEPPQRSRWSVAAVIVGMFASRVCNNGFAPLFSELLLAEACVSLGLQPYPAAECADSDAASSLASVRSSYFNLATTIPGIAAVSFFAMLSDARGRKINLILCYATGLIQCILFWLLPPGRVCAGSVCVESFWILLWVSAILAALSGDSLSISFAVMADVTEGAPASTRSVLFGLTEAFNLGGQMCGPVLTGYLAQHYGIPAGFLATAILIGVAWLAVQFVYSETLPEAKRKPFRWKAASPIGSVALLFKHGILVRFLLVLIFVDMAQQQSTLLYFTRLSGYGEEQNGVITTLQAAFCALGLLVLLPPMQRYMTTKSIVVLSVLGSTLWLFMNAMLAWKSVDKEIGVRVWPYLSSVVLVLCALWYPPVRACCAEIFGPERFAVALGAFAVVQQINATVGATVWPLIYAASLGKSSERDSSSSTSGSDGSETVETAGMPELVWYISAGWSLLGCFAAFSLPSLQQDNLERAATCLKSDSSGGLDTERSAAQLSVQ